MARRRLLVRVGDLEAWHNGFAYRHVHIFWGYPRGGGLWEQGFAQDGVSVRFQSDEKLKDYSPRVELNNVSEQSAKLALRVVKALRVNGWDTKLRDFLVALKAVRVDRHPDKSYHYQKAPSDEHPLVQLARLAD